MGSEGSDSESARQKPKRKLRVHGIGNPFRRRRRRRIDEQKPAKEKTWDFPEDPAKKEDWNGRLKGEKGRSQKKKANFDGIDLRKSNLYGCSFEGASFRKADLRNAVLKYTDFGFADLRGADVRGADLRFARLRYAKLAGAKWDEATDWGAMRAVISRLSARKSDGTFVILRPVPPVDLPIRRSKK